MGDDTIRHLNLRGGGSEVEEATIKKWTLRRGNWSTKPPSVFSSGFYKAVTKETTFLCGGERSDGRFGANLYSTQRGILQTVGTYSTPVQAITWERNTVILV